MSRYLAVTFRDGERERSLVVDTAGNDVVAETDCGDHAERVAKALNTVDAIGYVPTAQDGQEPADAASGEPKAASPVLGQSAGYVPASVLTWVEQVQIVDAEERTAVQALDDNPGWRLLATGTGLGGQTTLTYGWPWPGEPTQTPEAQVARIRREHALDNPPPFLEKPEPSETYCGVCVRYYPKGSPCPCCGGSTVDNCGHWAEPF